MSPRKKWCRGHQLRKELRFVLQILWLLVIVVFDNHVGMKGGTAIFGQGQRSTREQRLCTLGSPQPPLVSK